MPLNRTGGVGTVIDNLISGFAAEGVTALWYLTDHGYDAAQLAQILAHVPDVAVGPVGELGRFSAPVSHVHSYQENHALTDYIAGRNTVCTIHSLLALEETSNDVRLGNAVAWQERVIAESDCAVVLSRAEYDNYFALGYGRLNPRVQVIHNGVRRPATYRAPRGKRVLGFCGRLVPRKHPEYVQWMLNEPGFEDCRVLIAGRGFSPYARDLLRDRGLDSRVEFLGWCAGERLEAFFDCIDMLAVPSIYEPFGLVALEAAARGIPVVCTAIDGLTEVLGEHAFYAANTGFEAFAAAMYEWFAATPGELVARSQAARNRYERRFTDRMMGRRYRRLFGALSR
ncbi:MAG TPA: glycosyltransferase family 4 protein [Burkholderiaceae bacterium]|nr:glycosyltransferase family 4 protein [Burkholderiaceae bacterium]